MGFSGGRDLYPVINLNDTLSWFLQEEVFGPVLLCMQVDTHPSLISLVIKLVLYLF
jgi:acyl-CoA reductase-like NAD-dependent aldehyde dehydrogenase